MLCKYEHLRYVALSSGAWLSFQRPLLAQNYAFAAEYILSISVMFVDFGPDFLHSCFSCVCVYGEGERESIYSTSLEEAAFY